MSYKSILAVLLASTFLVIPSTQVFAVASQGQGNSAERKELELRKNLRDGMNNQNPDAAAKVGENHATVLARRQSLYKSRFENIVDRLNKLMAQYTSKYSESELAPAKQKIELARQAFAQAESSTNTSVSELRTITQENFVKGKAKLSNLGQKVSGSVSQYRTAFNYLKEATKELRKLDAKKKNKPTISLKSSRSPIPAVFEDKGIIKLDDPIN